MDLTLGVSLESGRPLAPATRAFLEHRFGADFRNVRLHTGARAASLARALGARAFTLGSDIFFAAGQFTPWTSAGLRLLAHELVHVLQQGAERPRPGTYVLGCPRDPLEQEADRVAEEVLAGGRLSPITPDRRPVIRRAIDVDEASAKVTVSASGILPAEAFFLTPQNPSGLLQTHLTKNFVPHPSGANFTIGDAWTAVGQVNVQVGPQDGPDLANWNFGFLQFQRISVASLVYAGRAKSHGGVNIQFHKPPALGRDFGIDYFAPGFPNAPFTRTDTSGSSRFDPAKGVATTAQVGDRPGLGVFGEVMNRTTGRPNFLRSLIDDRSFVTVFTARDPQGKFQHLAHFQWRVRWDFRFVWGGGIPFSTRVPTTSFKMGNVVLGADPDQIAAEGSPLRPLRARLKTFLDNPRQAHRLGTPDLTAAIRSSFVAPPPNRIDTDERFGEIPPDFFQP